MAPSRRKSLKIGRALRTAARLPGRVSHGRGSGRNTLSPAVGEQPVVLLRIQIEACTNLLSRDKSGTCDPFVAVSFLRKRHSTAVSKRTLNPSFSAKDATFDFPVYLSLAERLGVVELVVWDKDMLRKEYLGEVSLALEDWFKDGKALAFDDPMNKAFITHIVSTRASINATGSIRVKLGFVAPSNPGHEMTFDEIYAELLRRSQGATPSLVSAPPTEGMGTIRSHQTGPAFEDDGLSSDEGEPDIEDEDDFGEFTAAIPQPELRLQIPSSPLFEEPRSDVPASPTPPQIATIPPTQVSLRSPSTSRTGPPGIIPRIFPRRTSTAPSVSFDTPSTSTTPTANSSVVGPISTPPSTPGASDARKKKFRKSWGNKNVEYNFLAAPNDILGIVLLEIQKAEDLPRLKNITRTGWDMDPFVVISFGKKVFRTRVVRHSLNPTWDEKMLFHVRRYESAFKVQLTVLDWDKLSSNDHVGDAHFDVAELMQNAPQRDEKTGLYNEEADGSHDMQLFKLPILTGKEMPWETKHNPVLTVRAKYQPYDALRQRFWRQCLKQYDTDDTGLFSQLEITSMLISLGSTLSKATIGSFFSRHGKKPEEDELTTEEVIQCLEEELCRPKSEKKRLESDESLLHTSTPVTPSVFMPTEAHQAIALDLLDFSGQTAPAHKVGPPNVGPAHDPVKKPSLPQPYSTEPSEQPLVDAAAIDPSPPGSGHVFPMVRQSSTSSSDVDAEDSSSEENLKFERVINIKNCPLCHRPRLNSKAEMDIVTHIAVCASQDWAQVDRIVVGNFVTASQAQRKWYTKVITKVSSGNYKLGANSANIIVQNRMTGQLEEEKMQVYVRLGIRLFYKGAKSRMEGARARRLLKSLSIKQGIKYDSPESAREIPTFVEFHNLNVDEILEPIGSYKTFNQFFYRKLKPTARPIESPDDPTRLVSSADCRLMTFESVNEATRLWIKGREFTVARLLGEVYKDQAERYSGGALAIFRLAPQDYHRFHSPVDGTIGPMTYVAGEYYTVNPQAIRTALDVYGENARKIVPIDSPVFGRVMCVCVGAMMVGTIHTTVTEGEEIKRGQELGYFAFGGSTIVALFEKGVVEWDEDLLINGRASLETLVRVGMGIGRRRRPPSTRNHSVSPEKRT